MRKPIRFGIVGCGVVSDVHASNLSRIDAVELAAWCDVARERAERKLAEYGGAYATEDAQRILSDETIDAVAILTAQPGNPAGLHAELATRAARAGKHVFLENPLAENLPQAYDLVEAVNTSGVKFQHGLCLEYSPTVARAKQLLPYPTFSLFQSAGGLMAHACHHLDLIVHKFHEARLISVSACGATCFATDERLPIDSFSAILKFEDGSSATYVQHNAKNPALGDFSAQFFGSEGCVYLRDGFREALWYPTSGEEAEPYSDDEDYMGYRAEIEDFVRAIEQDDRPRNTAEHGKHVLAIENAIIESAQLGRAVELPR